MPRLRHFEFLVLKDKSASDSAQVPAASASVTVYKQGAIANGGGSVAEGGSGTITVHDSGAIRSGDIVFVGTATGVTALVGTVTATTVPISGVAGGTFSWSDGSRIVPNTGAPTLFSDSAGVDSVANPLTTSARGIAEAWADAESVWHIQSGSGVTTALFVDFGGDGGTRFRSDELNSAAALGYIFDTREALTTSGAKMFSFRTAGTERAAVGRDGTAIFPRLGPESALDSGGALRIVDGIKFALTGAGIQAAIDDLPASGGLVDVPTGTYTTSAAAITVGADVTVRGHGTSTVVQKEFSAPVFILSGANAAVENLKADGRQASGFTGRVISIESAANCAVRDCTVVNGNTYGIYMTGATAPQITGNRVSANLDIGIFGENNTLRAQVIGNYVDTTGATVTSAHCVSFHSTTAAQTVDHALVESNHLRAGASAGFCVEVGAFGGSTPKGCVVRGNTCIATAASAGGISFSPVDNGVISGNSYDANGNAASIGVEIVDCTGVAVIGNSILGGNGAGNDGISVNESSNCSVSHNIINGFGTAVDSGVGIHLIATGTQKSSHNTICGNMIKLRAASAGTGIWIQSNAAGAACDFNTVEGNVVTGDSTVSSKGFNITATGTAKKNILVGNVFQNLDQGIGISTANIDLLAERNVLDTITVINSGGSAVQNIAAAGDTINKTTSTVRLTSTGSITLTSAPTITDGYDLQRLKIINTDSVDTVTIQDQGTLAGSNLRLSAATIALAPRDSIELQYFDAIGDWVQVAQTNVV